MMLNAAPSACCASVSTLPNTMSGLSTEACSNTGPNCRQGPHHSAQKSRRTMSFSVTVLSSVSVVISTVAIGSPLLRLRTPVQREGYPDHSRVTPPLVLRRMGLHDRPHRPVEAQVVPAPAEHHAQPVLEADQVVEVHDEPRDPAEEPGDLDRPDLGHTGSPTDRGHRALVEVAELARGPAQDLLGDIAPCLHRGRREHRQRLAVMVGRGGDVADAVRVLGAEDAQVIVDREPLLLRARHTRMVRHHLRAHTRRPHDRRGRRARCPPASRHPLRRPTRPACRCAHQRPDVRARAARTSTTAS